MKLTMINCIEALKGFNKMASAKMPFKQTVLVARNVKSLEAVVIPFEEKRNEFVKELRNASYTEDGKQVVPDEAADKFRDDVNELLNEEIEVDVVTIKLSNDEFPDLKAEDIKGCIDYIEVE